MVYWTIDRKRLSGASIYGYWVTFATNLYFSPHKKYQCCGSGSIGSIGFWASRIRIRHFLCVSGSGSGCGSFHHLAKKVRITFDLYCFVLYDPLDCRSVTQCYTNPRGVSIHGYCATFASNLYFRLIINRMTTMLVHLRYRKNTLFTYLGHAV